MRFIFALLALALFCVDARAEANPDAVIPARCEVLRTADFAGIQDAPTQIVTATLQKTADGAADYCHVLGYVAPNIGIELGLPVNWNGKFFESGCAGYCGTTFFALLCDGVLQKGYACIASDSGTPGRLRAGDVGL